MFRIESKSIYSDPIDFGADIIDDKADDPVAAPTQSIKSIIEDRTSGILARNWAGIEQLSFAGAANDNELEWRRTA